MADIELVIKMPEGAYNLLKTSGVDWLGAEHILNVVANGTPLPKGHGRLIDADEAIKTLKSLGNRDYRREKGTIQEAVKMLDFDEYTPTIIEAGDAESEEV